MDYALFTLRHGDFAVLQGANGGLSLFTSAELASPATVTAMERLGGNVAMLTLSFARAARIGLAGDMPHSVTLPLSAVGGINHARAWIDPQLHPRPTPDMQRSAAAAMPAQHAALLATKLAMVIPAAVTVSAPAHDDAWLRENALVVVTAEQVENYYRDLALTLTPVAEAMVPLRGAEDARVVAFRPRHGIVEHLAVIVGTPGDAPLLRLHSSCVTGDILGSLRCDCGEQLHQSIEQMAQGGGGVLLYLNQEGRGIGIANKLRAYSLQDAGLDTVEANEALGFEPDERDFHAAASMLNHLGISRVRLLSNNPNKVTELSRHGITVTQRVPLMIPPNPHNAKYLDTKAKRCGHGV